MEAKKAKLEQPENDAVIRFRNYLRIKSVQPNTDYDGCIEFLSQEAKKLGLKTGQLEVAPNNPVFWMTWEGSDPTLTSVVLSSHMDVVPVESEHWKYDPFSAHKDEDGKIFARGAQDMKNISMQYVEAVSRLVKSGKRYRRTIHLLFNPDEEVGSFKGMQLFVKTKQFKDFNIGFVLDEGIANPKEEMRVFYGERIVWWIELRIGGRPGHGSQFIDNTVGPKLEYMMEKIQGMSRAEKARLDADPTLTLGDVMSANLTQVSGGCQANVVPGQITAVFDIRLPPQYGFERFEKELHQWCKEAGSDVTVHTIRKHVASAVTSTSSDYPWWAAFKSACDDLDLKIKTEVFPAGTDLRYFREAGYDGLGFSPMNNIPILLHDHNEYITEELFLRGCDIYEKIIANLADV